MKIWKTGILFLVAFLIQGSLLNLISVGGFTPNLLLALVVVLSYIYEGKISTVVYGAFFGLLYDVCFMTSVGQTGIMLALIAFLIYLADMIAERTNIFAFALTAVLSFVVYYFGEWIFIRIADNPIRFTAMLKAIPLPLILTFIVEIIIYLVLRHIDKIKRKKRNAYNG